MADRHRYPMQHTTSRQHLGLTQRSLGRWMLTIKMRLANAPFGDKRGDPNPLLVHAINRVHCRWLLGYMGILLAR